MSDHSPEPWRTCTRPMWQAERGLPEGGLWVWPLYIVEDDPEADEAPLVGLTFLEPDARRIVACVNACKGIPTETLEKCETGWYVLADAKTVSGINARLAEAEALIRQWLYRVDDKPVMESLAFLKAPAKP